MAIRINIVTQLDNRELKRAQRELKQLGADISRNLNFAVVGGLAAATAGLVSSVKAASNFMAEFEGVNQVFGDAAKSVQAFADTAAKTAGLSATEALQAAKTYGLFAKTAGMSSEASAEFATSLVQLAGDLGSFNDVPTADALAAIQSGLMGQAEPLRKFGVFLTDAKMKNEIFEQTGKKVTGTLSDQQKMMAAYGIIMKSTTIQQGDFVKYQDTFGNKVKTITKDFENLQGQIGQQLIPVLEEVLPAVQALIPEFGVKLKAAVEAVDWKALFTAIIDGVGWLIANGQTIATVAVAFVALSKGIEAVKVATVLANGAIALMTGTLTATPWGALALGLGAVAIAGYNIAEAMHKAYLEIDGVKEATEMLTNKDTIGGPRVNAARAAQGGAWANRQSEATKAYAASRKEIERITKAQKEYGNAFLASNPIISDSTTEADKFAAEIKKLMEQMNGATGKTEKNTLALKIRHAEQKKHAEERKAYWQALKAEAEQVQKETDALVDAQKAIGKAAKELNGIMTDTQLGEFESRVVSTFDNIRQSIESAIESGAITKAAGINLTNYADTTSKALAAIAKQRDALVAKRSLVEALFGDVKGSLMGAGSLSGLLEQTSKTVTKTVTSIVNGLQVAVTSTTEEITSGGLLKNFKAVLDKTKKFADQLKQLRKLGLDKNLFAEIVGAGAEAGGALANEIIAGGADAVAELNTAYKDLADVSGQIAEQTAVVMYNDGQDVAGGIVAGLMSQEQALISAAEALANAFISTFNQMMSNITIPSLAGMTGLNANGFAYNNAPAGTSGDDSQFGSGTPWAMAAARFASDPKVLVTVNAGLVASPEEVGSQINTALLAYKRSNGEI